MPNVRVMIVDDQAPFRNAARTVVGLTPGFDVVTEAQTGEEAVERADAEEIDLVLMDINMPGINGIEAVRRIKGAHASTTLFLLSTYSVGDLPSDARSCGAAAYINKEDFGPALLRALWDAGGDPEWSA